jgi:hypothetical protein
MRDPQALFALALGLRDPWFVKDAQATEAGLAARLRTWEHVSLPDM